MKKEISAQVLSGIIVIPASKSDAQRAILAAALANGKSVLHGFGSSDDELAMLDSIQELGAKVEQNVDGSLNVFGGLYPQGPMRISAGESGLGIRLLASVCASFTEEITIDGTGSLVNRPMDFFQEVLPNFGAKVRSNHGKVPLVVQGPLTGKKIEVDGSLSSQFISGCLMALPRAKSGSVLIANNLSSIPYVQMTLTTLKRFGIEIERLPNNTFVIPAPQTYRATEYKVEADWSSASFFLVAGALGHDIRIKGLDLSSHQADKALLEAFMAAGCRINHMNGEISIGGANKHHFEFDATHCPDLFPALVVLAASVNGISKILGASRLTHKESDRASTLQEEFGKLGLKIDLEGDTMLIHGTGKISGGSVVSHHDHRIAMCLAIAGTIASGPVIIDDAEAVSKSFPSFWDEFEKLSTQMLQK